MIKTYAIAALACLIMLASGCSAGEEVRGAWVSGWGHGYLSAEEVDATIAAAKKAGINTLYIQVRKIGDAYYKSTLEPRASNISKPDFDPLAYTIKQAHAQGIKVHAWVNAYRIWSKLPNPADPKHIVNAHPDWICKDVNGNITASEGQYLDPGVPAAREHIAKVVMEIVKNYDVDGVQWDYIRYPGVRWGYSETALKRYYADTKTSAKPDPKDEKWSQWRRDQVTELVRMVHKQVKAVKPKVIMSASTIAWGNYNPDFKKTDCYAGVFQDWKYWAANNILDANLPMVYKSEKYPKSAESFRGWLQGFKSWHGGKPTYVGIEVSFSDNDGVIAQIEAIRKAGLQGFVLFDFKQSKSRDALVDALAAAKNKAAASTKQ